MVPKWIPSLGREALLQRGIATHSSILAWKIPMDRGAWWAIVHVVTKSQTRLGLSNTFTLALFQVVCGSSFTVEHISLLWDSPGHQLRMSKTSTPLPGLQHTLTHAYTLFRWLTTHTHTPTHTHYLFKTHSMPAFSQLVYFCVSF